MKVEEVLIGVQPESSECLEDLLKIVEKKNVKLTIVEANKKINISKNCYIDILWPIKNSLISENALNNNSLVFKLYYNKFSILFTGDIEKIAEKQIVEEYRERLKCDILKVAHHGSKTSSIQEFLECSKPKIALIGVGKDNKFGHPNNEVIECLKNFSCNIFRTDEDGEIIIKIKNKKILINTKINN